MFNEQQKREVWKGVKILFWGLIGIAFVYFLTVLGYDISQLESPLIALATNAIVFTGWRYFKKRDQE